MSEIANALGVGPTFTFEGQTYRVGPRDFEVEAEMERHLASEDLRTIRRFEKDLGPAETQRQLADWRKAVTSKTWAFGSPDFVRYYTTPAGVRKSMYLQLAKHNPHVTEAVIDRVWDDLEKLQELDALLEQANADPLARGPEAKAATATTRTQS